MSRSSPNRVSNRTPAKRSADQPAAKPQASKPASTKSVAAKSTSAKSPRTRSSNALMRYLRDTRAEISKVTWPTREEGTRLTIIVMIATVISAIALFGIDTIFSLVITNLLGLF